MRRLFISALICGLGTAQAMACQLAGPNAKEEYQAGMDALRNQCAQSGGAWFKESARIAPMPFDPPKYTLLQMDYNPADDAVRGKAKFEQWQKDLKVSRAQYEAEYEAYSKRYHEQSLKRLLTVTRFDNCQDRFDKETRGSIIEGCLTPACDCGEDRCFSIQEERCVEYQTWKTRTAH